MERTRPSLTARLGAAVRGEVPENTVASVLAAGSGAYDDLFAAETLRTDLLVAGVDPWNASPAETSQLLCTWVAYSLQSLAQVFVETERQQGPPPAAGFLTPITAEQASRFASNVPTWLGWGRRAAADPGFDVAAQTPLPVQTLPWVSIERCPASHLAAMRSAARAMLDRLAPALGDLERGTDGSHGADIRQLRGLVAEVEARVSLPAGAPGERGWAGHEREEQELRDAVARCFVLGQLMARPRLLQRPTTPPTAARGTPAYPTPAPPPWSGHHGGYHGGHH